MKGLFVVRSEISLLVVCIGVIFIGGCSGGEGAKGVAAPVGPVGKVHGKLTVEGKPAPEGTRISFRGVKAGGEASGVTDASGTFSANNVAAGENTVVITGPSMKSDGSLLPVGGGIPEKYNGLTDFKEKMQVKEGEDVEYNLDMKN